MAGGRPASGAAVDWRIILAVGLWTLTGIAAVVLAGRGWAGAFDVRVPVLIPAVATGIATVASLGAAGLFLQSRERRSGRRETGGRRLVVELLSLTAPAVIAGATNVNAPPFALGLATGILTLGLSAVVVGEGVRVSSLVDASREVLDSGLEDREPTACGGSIETAADSGNHSRLELPDEAADDREPASDADFVQHWTRRQAVDGTERIEAVLLAHFAPGERETVLHLPIHPSLRGTPHVDCEPLDDSPVSTTVTAVRPYGVRIEVKRDIVTETGLHVPIGIEILAAESVAHVA